MIKTEWIKQAVELFLTVCPVYDTAKVYQLSCIHDGDPSMLIAYNRCIIRIKHSGLTSDKLPEIKMSHISDLSSFMAGTGKMSTDYLYTDNRNPVQYIEGETAINCLLGVNRISNPSSELIPMSILSPFDFVAFNNGLLYLIDTKKGAANWRKAKSVCDDAVAAMPSAWHKFTGSDLARYYKVGFTIQSGIFVAVLQHEKMPITAWVPLNFLTEPQDITFSVNGENIKITGTGDREKPYKYEQFIKGEVNMVPLTDVINQLGITEHKEANQQPVSSIIPSTVAEKVSTVATPVPTNTQELVEEIPETTAPAAEVVEQPGTTEAPAEATEAPKTPATAAELIQELTETIDAFVGAYNDVIKQLPKKLKAINKAMAAEAKSKTLDPKTEKYIEELEADRAMLKKIKGTLGI